MSSQNISRNRSSEQSLKSGEFLARLRNVSLDGTRNVPAPSENLQRACRPVNNSNFSRDFMNYQSKIKQELRRAISSDAGTAADGLQEVGTLDLISERPSVRSSSVFLRKGNPYVSEPPVYSARRHLETETFQNSDFSVERSENSAGTQYAATVVSRTAAAAEREHFLKSDAAQAFIPPKEAFQPVSESVSHQTAPEILRDEKRSTPTHFTAPNEGNPFGKLLSGKEPEKKTMIFSGEEGAAGWFASIRCFGILGLVSGGAVLACASNTAVPSHELTALGISLLIAGVAMFAAVGFLQAFTSRLGEPRKV